MPGRVHRGKLSAGAEHLWGSLSRFAESWLWVLESRLEGAALRGRACAPWLWAWHQGANCLELTELTHMKNRAPTGD